MSRVAYMIVVVAIGSFAVAWDPVRPGALVKPLGEMIIIDHSVRVLLKFDNMNSLRDNVMQINQGIQVVKDKMVNSRISNVRLDKKLDTIQQKITKVENNFLHSKAKRAVGIAVAVGVLAGLGVTNLGLYADLRLRVNNIEHSVTRIDTLTEETEDIQFTIDDIIANIEQLSVNTDDVKEFLEIFMALDQLYIKIHEVDTGMETLIQDLVMANAGHVTSTLFPISQLLNITRQARSEWNFQPFFDATNIALYYPILSSFINDSGVIVDIPFSSELKYHIYTFIPFPMEFNGSIVTIDTDLTSPVNYILSIDGLKESTITNDNLLSCKRTNVNLYLCPATYFTFNEALGHSCAASLVKNLTISTNCPFKEEHPIPYHETLQESHYFYFPNKTTVSVICPSLLPEIASIVGLYRVPVQCELHSSALTTVATRKQTITLTRESILQDITVTFSAKPHDFNIRRVNRKHIVRQLPPTHTNIVWYVTIILPPVVFIAVLTVLTLFLKRNLRRRMPTMKHISAP